MTYNWKENSWMRTFSKEIWVLWQTISSRIWTHVAVFILYDDNHYTKWAYFFKKKYVHTGIICVSLQINK